MSDLWISSRGLRNGSSHVIEFNRTLNWNNFWFLKTSKKPIRFLCIFDSAFGDQELGTFWHKWKSNCGQDWHCNYNLRNCVEVQIFCHHEFQ